MTKQLDMTKTNMHCETMGMLTSGTKMEYQSDQQLGGSVRFVTHA